jgi:hypothetical protein
MKQHKRLENMLMSAKVRGKHSLDLNLSEAGQLIYEYSNSENSIAELVIQIENLKKKLDLAQKAMIDPMPVISTSKTNKTKESTKDEFNGIMDGGSF